MGVGPASNSHSYRWTAVGGFVDLGLLAGAYATNANAISADGSVVAGQAALLAGRFHAFRWTASGGLADLGVLPGGNFTYGYGVSGNGLVVVGQGNDSTSSYSAYRWTGGVMTKLPHVTGSISDAAAWGANADGSVVVGQDFVGGATAGYRGFRWTAGGGTKTLPPLSGQKSSRAFCVSADGLVTAGVSNPASIDPPVSPVAWDAAGVIVNLGLPAGMSEAQPSCINADGSVIGLLLRTTDGGPRAGVWTAASGTVDLNIYLPTIGLDLTGWVLTRTYGVSADGRTLVGEGAYHDPAGTYVPGNFVASLGCVLPPTILTGPEPTSACPGGTVAFTVVPGGVGPFAFAWRHGGSPIDPAGNPSAATSTLTLASVQPADLGAYDCMVTNPCGHVTSPAAALTVRDCPYGACAADYDGSGGTPDTTDIIAFFADWLAGAECADVDCSGGTPDGTDIGVYFAAWLAGGC